MDRDRDQRSRVGIVAACLPTLKPIFDNCSIDSVVASVRSKVPWGSLGAKSSYGRSKIGMLDGSSGLELQPIGTSNVSHGYS